MAAMDRIAAAAQIDPSHSPGGANVHSHLVTVPRVKASLTLRHLDRFGSFAGLTVVNNAQITPRCLQ